MFVFSPGWLKLFLPWALSFFGEVESQSSDGVPECVDCVSSRGVGE